MIKFKRWKNWILILIILVIFLGISGYFYFDKTSIKAHILPSPVVALTKASIQKEPLSLTAIGTLIAPNDVTLMAEQGGQITGVYFKSGDLVQAGQVLFSIDNITQKAEVAQKKADYENTKAEYQRYVSLSKTPGMVSRETLDQNKANYLAAEGALEEAQKALAQTEVKAPFTGIVAAPQPVRGQTDMNGNSLSNITQIAPGSYVTVGTSLLEIVDQKDLLLQYTLPQEDLPLVKSGQTVLASTNAFKGQIFTGTVNYISPSLNTITRTLTLRALMDKTKQPGDLSPGMMMKVSQIIDQNHQALVIPAISLMTDLEGYHVYGLKDSKVLAIPVMVGTRYGENIEILKGLKEGDLIISGGMQKVHEGQLVQVAE